MKVVETADGFVVRCDIGEEIVSTLVKFATERDIHSGTVFGIGAMKELELGYYDVGGKQYMKKVFQGEYELLSLLGNFARLGSDTILHCHASFSDREFNVIGGHLFKANVAVTGEFYIRPGEVEILRGPDPATGLNLIKS